MTLPEADTLRASHFDELRRSLQALALPASTVLTLFPEFAVTADELALNFDRWASLVRSQYPAQLSSTQVDSLVAISRKLSTMSRDGADFDVDLWTESALSSSPHWDDVRRLALAALDTFGEVS